MRKQKIHFIFPRFHTNFIDIIDKLSDDIDVLVHVLFKHKGDDFLNERNINFLRKKNNLDPKLKIGPFTLFLLFTSINKNDIIVYRPLANYSKVFYFLNLLTIYLISKIKSCKLFFYNQIDYENHISIDKKFEFYYKIPPLSSIPLITPISSNLISGSIISFRKILLPFYIKCSDNINIINNSKKKIVFVGKLFEDRKRFDIFYNIVNYFVCKQSDFEFVICGIDNTLIDYKENELYKKFSDLGVKIHINLDRNLIFNIYKESLFLVYPTEFEQAGVSPIEAMSCGVIPLVYSGMNKMNLCSNYIQNFYNGFKIENNHYLNYVFIIEHILNNLDLLESMKNNCIQFSKDLSKESNDVWRTIII
jgi:hypothetical protein